MMTLVCTVNYLLFRLDDLYVGDPLARAPVIAYEGINEIHCGCVFRLDIVIETDNAVFDLQYLVRRDAVEGICPARSVIVYQFHFR